MTFFEAFEKLKEGKKVRKVKWPSNYYIDFNTKYDMIVDEDDSEYSLSHEDFIGDWELYKDSLLSTSDKLYLKTILNLHENYTATIFLESAQYDYYYIGIIFVGLDNEGCWHTYLPPFKAHTRFKNLELYTPYKLSQLELED